MRKQYHFWPGARRLDAWDVDRLIALSRDLPVREVALAEVAKLDGVYWTDGLSPKGLIEHIQLVQDADLRYPIILGADGRVMDGMHRIIRAVLDGHETIAAVQFTVHPEPDYVDCVPDELPYPDPNPGWTGDP